MHLDESCLFGDSLADDPGRLKNHLRHIGRAKPLGRIRYIPSILNDKTLTGFHILTTDAKNCNRSISLFAAYQSRL